MGGEGKKKEYRIYITRYLVVYYGSWLIAGMVWVKVQNSV